MCVRLRVCIGGCTCLCVKETPGVYRSLCVCVCETPGVYRSLCVCVDRGNCKFVYGYLQNCSVNKRGIY